MREEIFAKSPKTVIKNNHHSKKIEKTMNSIRKNRIEVSTSKDSFLQFHVLLCFILLFFVFRRNGWINNLYKRRKITKLSPYRTRTVRQVTNIQIAIHSQGRQIRLPLVYSMTKLHRSFQTLLSIRPKE